MFLPLSTDLPLFDSIQSLLRSGMNGFHFTGRGNATNALSSCSKDKQIDGDTVFMQMLEEIRTHRLTLSSNPIW